MLGFMTLFLINLEFQKHGTEALKIPYILTHSILGGGGYLTGGALFYRCKIASWKGCYGIMLFMCSIFIYIMDLPFYEITGGTAIFLIALKIKIQSNLFFLTLRRLSMWIYYLHMFFIFGINILLPKAEMTLFEVFLTASLSTLLVAFFIDTICHKYESLRFIQRLIK